SVRKPPSSLQVPDGEARLSVAVCAPAALFWGSTAAPLPGRMISSASLPVKKLDGRSASKFCAKVVGKCSRLFRTGPPPVADKDRWIRIRIHANLPLKDQQRLGSRPECASQGSAMLRSPSLFFVSAVAVFFALPIVETAAFERVEAPSAKPEMVENCPGLVARDNARVLPAALKAALDPDQVRITYVGHATFLIESPQLVRIATDYNDYVRPPVLPDIVTMNHAHGTHYTDHPDPAIPHVLRGWGATPEQPARHDLTLRDVRVRNVPTNIRDWRGGTERHGNSIFIFEIANMCIAHLGHLHHTLTQQQLNEIGRV